MCRNLQGTLCCSRLLIAKGPTYTEIKSCKMSNLISATCLDHE
ncbi:hypothetical protein Plhal304r1_c022g0076941 [Plasmopara halstedii]